MDIRLLGRGSVDSGSGRKRQDAPGIVITDGGVGARIGHRSPRVRAFIYGEEAPVSPTLPFGRWKKAS